MFDKIAYVEHPVSTDDKKKLNKDGFKVVDLKFKPDILPEGAKVVEKPKGKK